MKTHLLILLALIFSTLHSQAERPIELVVYSPLKSESELHVETVEKDPTKPAKSWTFPSSYTGHRAVCILPGATTNDAFCAWIGGENYVPGNPFGVSSMREHPAIELTDMSSITPRVNLWSGNCDRTTRTGTDWLNIGSSLYDRFKKTNATVPKNRVCVVRYSVDNFPVYQASVPARVVIEKNFEETSRDFLNEGDFLADGYLDIDWENLYTEVVDSQEVQLLAANVTNVTYLIVYNWDKSEYASYNDTNTQVRANATLVTRRFEKTRSVPTTISATVYSTDTTTNCTFKFRVDNEEKWASWFGTTYTAFKVKVLNGSTEVWNSGIIRLPPRDKNGVYTFTTTNNEQLTANNSLTWRVAVYNSKFKTDTLMAMETEGDPFSPAKPITIIGE